MKTESIQLTELQKALYNSNAKMFYQQMASLSLLIGKDRTEAIIKKSFKVLAAKWIIEWMDVYLSKYKEN